MNTSEEQVKLGDIEIESRAVGHLGLISTYFNELGLKDFFDTLLPKTRKHNISHGTAVLAFLLNGLSFTRRQLYLFPEFFSDLALPRLLGDGIEPEHLNDAVMGELLDKIYAFGPTELFGHLVSHILRHEKLDLSRLHADTTNFSVHGEYEVHPFELAPERPAVKITFGHPKDGRWDLKRFVLSLLVNADGIPLFMKTHSGNASDHQTIKEAMDNVCESLRDTGDEEYCFVADAAFYTQKNICDFQGKWVSRVPSTIKEAQELLHSEHNLVASNDDPRYSYHEGISHYGEVEQKWVLVHSEYMSVKMEKTFNKQLVKQIEEGQKALVHLNNKEFACEADGLSYAHEWAKKYPLLRFGELGVEQQYRRAAGLKGRPKNGEELSAVYFIDACLEEDKEAVAVAKNRLGRFILASNDMTLNGEEMLKIYKEQMHVEQGFRFLKNKSFLVSETYVKKPERIEALSFIMVLCLMIYSLLEYKLRKGLDENEKTIPNSLGKATQKPTLEWAFRFFSRIVESTFMVEGAIRKVHLTKPRDKCTVATILSALGNVYEKCYFGI